MPRIEHYWLASYPKSGNTWMRLFLYNLAHSNTDSKELLTNFNVGQLASNRQWVEQNLGIAIDELTHDEIDALRANAYRWYFEHSHEDKPTFAQFHKIHDAYRLLPNGQPLIPNLTNCGVVYLVRNPLDIAVSGANHASITIDQSVQSICNHKFVLDGENGMPNIQLRQIIGSWSDHVSSWSQTKLNKLIVRYEDMKHSPMVSFQSIAQYVGLPSDRKSIDAALSKCQFEKIQQLENSFGFKEKSHKVKHFFRKGIVGDWVNHLNDQQIDLIIETHGTIMQKMGYLDDDGTPLPTPKAMR